MDKMAPSHLISFRTFSFHRNVCHRLITSSTFPSWIISCFIGSKQRKCHRVRNRGIVILAISLPFCRVEYKICYVIVWLWKCSNFFVLSYSIYIEYIIVEVHSSRTTLLAFWDHNDDISICSYSLYVSF